MRRIPSKYKAIRTTVNGVTFASKREAKRYGELLLLEKAGEIWDLELQPRYPITIGGVKVCEYRADFRYKEHCDLYAKGDKRATFIVVEDSKGMKTPVYRLKKKLMLALYGIAIRET